MDCPSEENLIRMALGGLTGVGPMTFDLAHRQLRVVHSGEPARIAQKLTPLNLGAVLLTSERRTEGGQWKTRFSVPKMDCPSEENLIRMALADASARWEHLWQEGLPYVTLLRNGINHPDDRGHSLFSEELIKCFD